MGEIININLGQCGVRVGHQFWKIIEEQHQIYEKEQRGLLKFFSKTEDIVENRAIFLDTNTRTIDSIRSSNILHQYKPQNLISVNHPSNNIYGQAYYHSAPLCRQQAIDIIRKQAELCDCFSGFVLISALSGGTSSGLTCALLNSVRQQYPDRMMECHTLFPDLKRNVNPIQIYNSVFHLHQQVEQCDIVTYVDNQALENRMKRQMLKNQSFDQINQYFAKVIAELTAPYRFGGNLHTNQRKMATNLIIFPRMHFLCPSISDFGSKHMIHPMNSAITPQNYLLSDFLGSREYQILTLSAHSRDNFGYEGQIYDIISKQFSNSGLKFTEWLPRSLHISFSEQPAAQKSSSSVLLNGRHMCQIYKNLAEQFTRSFRRKAFLYHYLSTGMDQMEFTEAESNMNDLSSEYAPYEYYDFEEEGNYQ